MTPNVITPPLAMMAIALKSEIQDWIHRANELLPAAHAEYLEQIAEAQEASQTAKHVPGYKGYTPPPFPYEHLTVASFKISYTDAISILDEMVRCWIATRSVFEKPQYHELDRRLGVILPWYQGVTNRCDTIASSFYSEVIDNVFIEIHNMLEPFIAQDTWDVWSVVCVNRSQFVIKNDGDYRVLEWEQLVQNGVVECPVRSQLSTPKAPAIRKVVISKLPYADWSNAVDETGARINPIEKGSLYELIRNEAHGE